ncbi:MAG: methyltransferase domain-containing protein [bacterium]|nr:methyltransferase domain-containing protein [bacterium]
MSQPPRPELAGDLKRYYQSSTLYRDDLITHDERFLEPYLILVERYLRKPARVLDLGCGAALSTRMLIQRGYDAVGADWSPLFLAVEKQANPETGLVASDALRLPFSDGCFDAVAAFEFVEHISDVPALLEEMSRVLKPGGWIFFHSPNLISPYLPAYDLLRMMMGGEGRPVFAETPSQAWSWLMRNLTLSLRKKFSLRPAFTYREPDLSENRIGGDADSVYLSNPMDLSSCLRRKGFIIEQRAHAMSLKNKFLAAVTPNFAPYMGLVAYKRNVL